MRFCIAVLLLALTGAAFAHDHARPDLDTWFNSLESKAGSTCCDASEATRLDDVDWEAKDGHYRVRLQGEWVDVPDDAVVEGPNKAGPTMVWPYYTNGELKGVRCFLPGAGI